MLVVLLWVFGGVPIDFSLFEAEPNCETSDHALVEAAMAGDSRAIATLLDLGFDAEGSDREGLHPLECAVAAGHQPSVELLLAAGADPVNALWSAAHHGRADLMEDLLAAGADPDHPEPDGALPLLEALGGGHEATVMVLLDGGADATVRQQAPIRKAAARHSPELVSALLDRGADPTVAIPVASGRADTEVLTILLRRGGDPPPEVLAYAAAPAVPLLIAEGVEVDGLIDAQVLHTELLGGCLLAYSDETCPPELLGPGWDTLPEMVMPLHVAVLRDDEEVVAALLAAGANPEGSSEVTPTPVELAVQLDRPQLVELLVAAGARSPG